MTTTGQEIEAYSVDTDTHYRSWDELVAAETNGYVVVGVSERLHSVPVVIGPYALKSEAQRKQASLRGKWRREEAPHSVHVYVRLLWKDS